MTFTASWWRLIPWTHAAHGADDLESARERLLGLAAAAESDGFLVSDDWVVTLAPTVLDSSGMAVKRSECEFWQFRITHVAREWVDADERTARRLHDGARDVDRTSSFDGALPFAAAGAAAALQAILPALVATMGTWWVLTHRDEVAAAVHAATDAVDDIFSSLSDQIDARLDRWFSDNVPTDASEIREVLGELDRGHNSRVRTVPSEEDVQDLYDAISPGVRICATRYRRLRSVEKRQFST